MTLDAVVDAHHHLCELSSLSYPWLEGDPVARYHGDDLSLRRDYLLPDYRADLAGLPLTGSVHVENGAADPLAETAWIQRVHDDNGLPSVHVAKVDLGRGDAPDRLEEIASFPVVRGIRDILNWNPDPYYSHRDRPDIMLEPTWRENFARLEGLGLSFDLQVFPDQLEQATALARAFPGTRIILDHAGMPIDRSPEGLDAWRDRLRPLAGLPNVVCKISALGTNDHAWTIDSFRPIVAFVIDGFGPERAMFGSNFPVDGLYSSLRRLYEAFDALTAGYGEQERHHLFAGTAARTYRFSPTRPVISGPGPPAPRSDGSRDVRP